MGRTSRAVRRSLLALVLAAVTIPTAVNLVPAFLPNAENAVVSVPAVQLAPESLASISGVSSLSAQAPMPDAGVLAKALDASLAVEGVGDLSAYVSDALTGEELYSRNGSAPRIPASNLKLLTAVAALKSLGATTRLTTSVVAGTKAGSLVLRAGGDSMLGLGENSPTAVMGHAGLESLAQETASALLAAGVTGPVTLAIDDSLFSGPAVNPNWEGGDVDAGEIAPIYPMALYAARQSEGDTRSPRPQDSAMAVGRAFATALEKAGVASQGTISREVAGSGRVLAQVHSATVAQQVQYLLMESNNYVAEVLARVVAVKEKQLSSYTGAIRAVRDVLTAAGVNLVGVVMVDNCGLAAGNLISTQQLVKVVSFIVANAGNDVGLALEGLPIAGLSGTLDNRFVGNDAPTAAGLVRAKTGTLFTVSALSGYVINSHGRLLLFSIIGNNLRSGPDSAVPIIDACAAVIAGS